jgi:hypothetical protein
VEEYLNDLRDESIYIKVEAKDKIAGAIDVENLIKILSSINQSYKCFLEIEIQKDPNIKKTTDTAKKEIKQFIKESELLIVDLDFASFGAAISPNTIKNTPFSNIKNGLKLKKRTFEEYKANVFYGDFKNEQFLKEIEKRYSEEERASIYKPLFSNIYTNKNVKFYSGRDKKHLRLFTRATLSKKVLGILNPEISKEREIVKDEETYAIYVTSSDEPDLFGKKPKYTKVLATEKLERPVYPYQLNEIRVNANLYQFQKKLSAEVTFEEDMFFITHRDLNIEVWGDTRKQAEEAFNFMLGSIISNIYHEEDDKLTTKAQVLKSILKDIIK